MWTAICTFTPPSHHDLGLTHARHWPNAAIGCSLGYDKDVSHARLHHGVTIAASTAKEIEVGNLLQIQV